MKIIRTGYNYRHGAEFKINRPSGSGDYLLLIIRSDAFAAINGEKKLINPNSALIYKKGTPQLYGAVGESFINDWVHFALEAGEEEIFSHLGIPFDTVIPLGDTAELSSFIKNVAFEKHSRNMHKDATMKLYFELILLKLAEQLNGTPPQQEHPHYRQFVNLRNHIRLDPQEDWSIDIICKKMMLSRSYIQHLYKLFFERSITEDIKRGRIERAKYLLSSSNMTVTSVSRACGYESDVHFMRVFKAETGLTATEYRSKLKLLHYGNT